MNWTFYSASTRLVFHHEIDSSPVFFLDPHPDSHINQATLNFNNLAVATGGKDGRAKLTSIKARREIYDLTDSNSVA
jgi:hypothetical protein